MNKNQDQDQSSTGQDKDSGTAAAEKATTDKRQEDRSKPEKSGEKDGAVLGKINDD
ncbi:hypothetical protein [Marinobacter sp. ATCH36]|uniref:hypothetical protein n=1 Tax=Marinobacter sp. ATCH36 TaxID=2945106 RepID=UPI0020201B20|nr:hypothetical protein [Marinobacter sp. ATCH36]MCL7945414.1 hypothetical protein [Marinobacter sp. ATCH36]